MLCSYPQKLAHILDPVSELAPLLIKPVQRICKYPLLISVSTTVEYYCPLGS